MVVSVNMAMVAVCACAVSDIVLVAVHARPPVVLQMICQAVPVRLAAHCKPDQASMCVSCVPSVVRQQWSKLQTACHTCLHLNKGVHLPVCWAADWLLFAKRAGFCLHFGFLCLSLCLVNAFKWCRPFQGCFGSWAAPSQLPHTWL